MSTGTTADDRIARLERADRRLRDLEEEIESVGREDVEEVAEAYDDAVSLLDGYQDKASGTGREEFQAFVRFKAQFENLVENVPDDVPRRGGFEKAFEAVDKRRLSEDDFERARSFLEPVAEVADLLEDRSRARGDYREARATVVERRREVEDEIADLQRLQELSEADLSAPTERLEEPIAEYDRAVEEAFDSFRRAASARELLGLVLETRSFPLVEFPQPPGELVEYVRTSEAGQESASTLLEYADYSRSKLDHYVEDPAELKRRIATRRTYLEGLDAGPLTVGWPPPSAGHLQYFLREAIQVCNRFADDDVVALAREVRSLPERTDYERLRNATVAENRLDESERRRIAAGELEDDLERLEEERDRLAAALEEHPER